MKRIFSLALAVLMLALVPVCALAASAEAEGTCGEGLTWTLRDHILTISGSGDMEDGCPWEEYKDEIRSVVLTGGVSRIGAEAFSECEKLKDIDFGDSLREIGPKAFVDCDRISYLILPKTFRSFEAECFRECDSLTMIYCYGPMPHFRDSCLWNGNNINIYFSLVNPWPVEYTSPLASAYGGRLNFYGHNDSIIDEFAADTYESREQPQATVSETVPETTAEPAAEPTAETVPETTVAAPVPQTTPVQTPAPTLPAPTAAAEPAAVPTTAPTEPFPTAPPTQAPTTPAPTVSTTEPPTMPTIEPLPERKVGGDGWIGLAIIGGVLSVLLLGILIYRIASHRGNRY